MDVPDDFSKLCMTRGFPEICYMIHGQRPKCAWLALTADELEIYSLIHLYHLQLQPYPLSDDSNVQTPSYQPQLLKHIRLPAV
jgi:hypothetical protein